MFARMRAAALTSRGGRPQRCPDQGHQELHGEKGAGQLLTARNHDARMVAQAAQVT